MPYNKYRVLLRVMPAIGNDEEKQLDSNVLSKLHLIELFVRTSLRAFGLIKRDHPQQNIMMKATKAKRINEMK